MPSFCLVLRICVGSKTSFATLLSSEYKKAATEKSALAKNLIKTPVDIEVDPINKSHLFLKIVATPRYNKAVDKLCEALNKSNTNFPSLPWPLSGDLTFVFTTKPDRIRV